MLLLSLLLFAAICSFLLFVTRALKLLNSLAIIPLNPFCLLISVLESKLLQRTLQAFAALPMLLFMLLVLLLFAAKRFLILFAILAYIFLAVS
jgi:hypothetical protein